MTGTTTDGIPRLLQPWGVAMLALVAVAAFGLAYWRQRARPGRPALHLDVAALSLLGLLTGGFFWRPLTERNVWTPAGGGDLASFYFPTYSYIAQQIKAGSIPLWNPHLFAGMPLAADVQTAMFYPINWILFLFVNVDYGSLEWLLIAHYWLAATFMYIFMRDAGLSRLGALGGGITFAFCGFMAAHFGHLPMVPVAAWIPLVLLCLRRAYIAPGRKGWAWSIGAGLSLTMALLAGHVQIFAYGLMAAGLLWLVLLLSDQNLKLETWNLKLVKVVAQWAAKGLLAVGLALAIGAIQLLPSLELNAQSVRSSVSYEESAEFPAQPITLLNLILPRVYGSNPTNYSFGEYQTTENWGYVGVIALALAALGLAVRRGRMTAFFAILVALALIIMLGDLTIVSGWVYKFMPGFNKLRDSGRALMLLGLGVAGLAAYGLDGLVAAVREKSKVQSPKSKVEHSSSIVRRPSSVVFWWLAGISGLLALATLLVMPALFLEILANQTLQYSFLPGAINDLGVAVLWFGLLAGVGWAAYRGRLKPEWAGALAFALLVLDVFSPNSQFNPTTTDITAGFKHFDAMAVIRKQTRDDVVGIPLRADSDTNVQNVWQPSSAVLHDFYDTGGAWNPLKLARYDALWDAAKRYPDSPLYDLTGAGLQIISPTLNAHAGQPKWELLHNEKQLQIYRNKNALPRAFLVHDMDVVTNPEAVILALQRFDVNPRHTVLLENGAPSRSAELGTAEPGSSGESVRVTRYAPNDVDLDVTAKTPGWLVLTDAWYPGWQAAVDGQDAPIEPAYTAYRAVHIEAGVHKVAMRFRPASWVWGRLISLAALAVALVALAALLFSRTTRETRIKPTKITS